MKNSIIPIILLILALTAVFTMMKLNTGDDPGPGVSRPSQISATAKQTEKHTAEVKREVTVTPRVNHDSPGKQTQPSEPTQEERYQIMEWSARIGFPQGSSEYETYDFDTLLELAKQGDIQALHLVGKKSITDEDTDVARYYFTDCAARGSVACILDLASLNQRELFPTTAIGYKENEDSQRKQIIEMMAWYETAERRGFVPVQVQREAIKKNFQIELTAEEVSRITQRSNEQYEMLEDMRRSYGFDPFDNTVPEAVLRFGFPEAGTPSESLPEGPG